MPILHTSRLGVYENLPGTSPCVPGDGPATATFFHLGTFGPVVTFAGPVTVSSGALPPGCAPFICMAASALYVRGVPTALGIYTYQLDTLMSNASHVLWDVVQTVDLIGGCPLITITPAAFPPSYLQAPFWQRLEASGGAAPYAWDLAEGSVLPAGFALSGDGVLSGTPEAGGSSTFAIRVTDDNGCTGIRVYTLEVSGLRIVIAGEDVTLAVDACEIELGLNRQAMARLTIGDGDIPARGADVLIYARDGFTPIFGGLVLVRHVTAMTPHHPANKAGVDCVDYSIYFEDASVTIVSTVSQDLEDVIAEIVDQALDAYGITYTPTATGHTVPPIEWREISVTDAFKRITDATGVVFRVLPLKELDVFEPLADPAPVSITDATINAFDLEWHDPANLPKNTVDLLCGPTGSGVATQQWTADGIATTWEVDIQAVLGTAEPARRANAYLSPAGATNFSDGDTIGAGSSTYTFRAALVGDVAGEVLIGATVNDSLANLNAAINLAGGGVYAPSTAANADVSSYLRAADQLEVDALVVGAAGNAIAVTSSHEAIAFWYGEGGTPRSTLQLGADATGAGGWTQGYVLENGSVQRPIGPIGSGTWYEWDVTTGRGTVALGSGTAPPAGTLLELKYLAVFPFHAIVSSGSPPRTFRETHPEYVNYSDGIAAATQILARESTDRRELEVSTDVDGFLPGQALDVNTTLRGGIVAEFLVATVRIVLVNAELWEYTVTAQQSDEYAGSYVDQWKALTAGVTSGAAPTPLEDGGAAVAGDIYSDGRNAFRADQSLGGHKLTDVADPASAQDAATKGYVDAAAPAGVILADGSVDFAADESMGGFNLTDLADPAADQDAATKAYVDAAMGAGFAIESANVAANESTSSTSYTDLTTDGPSVTVVTGSSVSIFMSAQADRTGTGNTAYISVAVSGATTIAAADANGAHESSALSTGSNSIARVLHLTGLTPGSNTFKLRYRVDGGTWNFHKRSIAVAYRAGNRASLAAAALAARIASRI